MTPIGMPLPATSVPAATTTTTGDGSATAGAGDGFAALVAGLLGLGDPAALPTETATEEPGTDEDAPGVETDDAPVTDEVDRTDLLPHPTTPVVPFPPELPAVPGSLAGAAGIPTARPAVGPTGPDAPEHPAPPRSAPSGPDPVLVPDHQSPAPSTGAPVADPTVAVASGDPAPEALRSPSPTPGAADPGQPVQPAQPVQPVTAAAPVAPVTPAGAPDLPPGLTDAGRQVGPVLVRLVESAPAPPSTQRVTLQLNPADLGEVRATVSLRDGSLRVTLAAGPEARELLRQDHPLLRHVLELTGADRVEIAVRTLPSQAPAHRDLLDPGLPVAFDPAPDQQPSHERPGGSGLPDRSGQPGRHGNAAATGSPAADPDQPADRPTRPGGSGVDLSI